MYSSDKYKLQAAICYVFVVLHNSVFVTLFYLHWLFTFPSWCIFYSCLPSVVQSTCHRDCKWQVKLRISCKTFSLIHFRWMFTIHDKQKHVFKRFKHLNVDNNTDLTPKYSWLHVEKGFLDQGKPSVIIHFSCLPELLLLSSPHWPFKNDPNCWFTHSWSFSISLIDLFSAYLYLILIVPVKLPPNVNPTPQQILRSFKKITTMLLNVK